MTVTDEYRWLEDSDDPTVKAWSDSQNTRSRRYLDHLASRALLLRRFKDLTGSGSIDYAIRQDAAGTLFALKSDPTKQQPMLVTLASANDLHSERVVLDPNALDATGSIAIDFAAPSIDGTYVAVSLSANGSEDGSARVYQVATGTRLADSVPRVNFATGGGSIAWKADNSGFYYTRYPQGNERPKADLNFYQQVYFHRLGTASRLDTNLRGGGEYGEDWHKAGSLTHKQNVFDDYIACAEYLVRRRYTSPSHLAALGVSNGGLLMGAVLTQRPDLFRAVVSYVGFYDLLRFELEPNGEFNTTEFGTVKNPEQFKALYAYSPYHHVKDQTRYPAILFLTGANDGRVNPYHSRKMLARLQAANSGPDPILLVTSSTSGHGFNSALDEQITGFADVYTFLFDRLGVAYRRF